VAAAPAGGYQPFPAFSQATDSASLAGWAAANLVGGDKWTYLDEHWAVYVTRIDKDDNPPFRLAVVHFEVTTQAMATLVQARSLSRILEADCTTRSDRWLKTVAFAGNNNMGDEVPSTEETSDFAPFPDTHTAEGAVADALCAPAR
jgi:hypothetical protein